MHTAWLHAGKAASKTRRLVFLLEAANNAPADLM